MKKLDFIAAYLDWCGESECPTEYLKWSALSLLAAACSNRIYTTRNIGSHEVQIVPNLYIILVGPSANFKSFALSRIELILNGTDYSQILNKYNGKITAPAMYDSMKSTWRIRDETGKFKVVEKPYRKQFYLLNDELANDVGSIEFADLLIKSLTRMYIGGPFEDYTRTSGHVEIKDYSVNWFACTTPEWLIRAISTDTILAGFLGRTIFVNQGYSDKRIWESVVNPKAAKYYEYLTNRITELYDSYGCVPLSDHALRVARSWYFSRETPDPNDHTMGSFRRQCDISLKLALLLALSRHVGEIDDDMLVEAQDLTEQAIKWQKEIVPDIVRGQRMTNETRLLTEIKIRGKMKHCDIAKKAYDRFNMSASVFRGIVNTWVETGLIEAQHNPRSKGGDIYVATNK